MYQTSMKTNYKKNNNDRPHTAVRLRFQRYFWSFPPDTPFLSYKYFIFEVVLACLVTVQKEILIKHLAMQAGHENYNSWW